jgi:hypothetical protein
MTWIGERTRECDGVVSLRLAAEGGEALPPSSQAST